RLAALTGVTEYADAGRTVLHMLAEHLDGHPTAFTHAVAAADLIVSGATEIAVVGERPDLVAAVQERYLPNAVLAWGERYPSPLFDERADGLAYVCRNYACKLPTGDVDELVTQLSPTAAVDDRV